MKYIVIIIKLKFHLLLIRNNAYIKSYYIKT